MNCVLGLRQTLNFHPLHMQPTWPTQPGCYFNTSVLADHSSTLVILLLWNCYVFHVTYHCTTHAAHVHQLNWWIYEPCAALLPSAEMWKLEHIFFVFDNCAIFPRSGVIGSTHRITDARTDRKFMDLPIPSPKHIIPNHPFYFFAFCKKVVDGKNCGRMQL